MTTFGSEILTSDFPHDKGEADPELRSALLLHESVPGPATLALVVERLKAARVLIPVVAVATEIAADGSDKRSEIQQVHFESNDGRSAMLVFSSLAELHLWNPAARPVPQWAKLVAATVSEQGHSALIIDIASSHRIAIPVADLSRLSSTN